MGRQDDAYEIIQTLLSSNAISFSFEKNNDSQANTISTGANTYTQYSQDQVIERNLMDILNDEEELARMH